MLEQNDHEILKAIMDKKSLNNRYDVKGQILDYFEENMNLNQPKFYTTTFFKEVVSSALKE